VGVIQRVVLREGSVNVMKNKHFIDWESETFGYGYGSGEVWTIPALRKFLELCNEGDYEHAYNHEVLEKKLKSTVAWLLINILCHADIIEYGTSPRYGWLTKKGELLKSFMANKTEDELLEMISVDQYYNHCYKDYCNCDSPCNNPLFYESK
jgi:hypothetical protein